MPRINEFFTSKPEDKQDNRVERIEQERPCSKCNLTSPSYNFNQATLELYWKCPAGHETRYKLS